MANYTSEEQQFILNHLIPGCTGTWLTDSGQKDCTFIFNTNKTISFSKNDYEQDWPIMKYLSIYEKRFKNFLYPDGSPMLVREKPLTKEQRVCKKIKTLWNNSNYVLNNPKRAY